MKWIVILIEKTCYQLYFQLFNVSDPKINNKL